MNNEVKHTTLFMSMVRFFFWGGRLIKPHTNRVLGILFFVLVYIGLREGSHNKKRKNKKKSIPSIEKLSYLRNRNFQFRVNRREGGGHF